MGSKWLVLVGVCVALGVPSSMAVRLSAGQLPPLPSPAAFNPRALVNQPTVLLADEPTGALDSAGAEETLELLRRLHAGGQTMLLVTHDATVAQAADRIVAMRDGVVEA